MRYVTAVAALGLLLAVTGTAWAITIDGTSSPGEWDDATVIPVASAKGNVSVYADTNYLYALLDVTGDILDTRLPGEYDHGEKVGININPSGNTWATYQCDLIFQTCMSAAGWGGTSAGAIDGFAASQWNVNGADQTSLPAHLATVTLYDTGHRVTELMMPLDTIAPSVGDTLRIGGAVDFSGSSYKYPPGIDWLDPGTYAEITVVPEPVTMAGLMLGIGAIGGYIRRRRG